MTTEGSRGFKRVLYWFKLRFWEDREVPWSWWLLFFLVLAIYFQAALFSHSIPAKTAAAHQIRGWEFLNGWYSGTFWLNFWDVSSIGPPLYHLVQALVLGILGDTQFLAFCSNLLGLFLLSYATYRLAGFFVPPPAAPVAGVLTLLFPIVVWLSRESLPGILLAGWVAMATWLVAESVYFKKRGLALWFGLVCAAGVLTHWSFPLYLAAPVAYAVWKSEERWTTLTNLAAAALVGVPLTLIYYSPTFAALLGFYPSMESAGPYAFALLPGQAGPGPETVLGWAYYPRILAGYFLFLPLTLFFAAGAILSFGQFLHRAGKRSVQLGRKLIRRGAQGETRSIPCGFTWRVDFLWYWLLGGMLFLTLLPSKDPLLALPLACPLAILLVCVWGDRNRLIGIILAIAFVQFLTVSFPISTSPISTSPIRVALWGAEESRESQTSWREWVLYQTDYRSGSAVRQEPAPYREILDRIPRGKTVAFLADSLRFHFEGFLLEAVRSGKRIRVVPSMGASRGSAQVDFLISQTPSRSHPAGGAKASEPLYWECWSPVFTWTLADDTRATLWRNPERLPDLSAEKTAGADGDGDLQPSDSGTNPVPNRR